MLGEISISNKKISFKFDYYIFLLIFYLLLFQDPIKIHLDMYGIVDELVTYTSLIVFIMYTIKYKKINKYSFYILILSILLIVVGLIGNITYEYQPMNVAIKDILILFKSLIIYVFTRNCLTDLNLLIYRKSFVGQLKFITKVIFTLSLINFIFPIFPSYDNRYGINSQQLFFSHPTYLANTCILLSSLIYSLENNQKTKYINMAMLTISILLTLRGKAIGFISVFYFIIYITCIKNKKINKFHIIIITILLTTIGYKQLKHQIIENDTYPRSRLYRYSIQIAIDHVPIGSGFGTYGSHVSGESYSPVYYKYNMEETHGINKNDYSAVSDTFWPMIIGQFGIIGLILYGSIVLVIVKEINGKRFKHNLYYIGAISPIIYLIISSISESSFANYYSVEFMFISGVFTNILFKKDIDKEGDNYIEGIINK